ncbi:MAG: hypothetical protein N2C14_19490 [Planctomycetales bacterium]
MNIEPDDLDASADLDASKPSSGRNRKWKVGFVLSALVHVAIIALLVWLPYQYLMMTGGDSKDQKKPTETASAASPGKDSPSDAAAKSNPKEPTKEVIQDKFQEFQEKLDELDEEQKIDQLERSTKALNKLSTPESADEIAQTLEKQLGFEAQPAEPIQPRKQDENGRSGASLINMQQSQIHSVSRVRDGQGKWQYVAVLMDSKGNAMDVPIPDDATGESLYRIFQTIEANPLLGQVYRQSVIPLMNQMLAAQAKVEQESRRERSPLSDPNSPTNKDATDEGSAKKNSTVEKEN